MAELAEQVEMGQSATDSDYVTFQRSVSANVKGAAKTRQEILLRKLFRIAPELAEIFDPSIIAESGVSGRITNLGDSISDLIGQINGKYAAIIDDLYFLFRESVGTRLDDARPQSFTHVNELRTDLRHDVDHGDARKVRAKRRKAGFYICDLCRKRNPRHSRASQIPARSVQPFGRNRGRLEEPSLESVLRSYSQ
jgi:hypothetical protein